MSIYETLLLLTATAVLLLSLTASSYRGAWWIVVIMSDAVISDVYVGTGFPVPDAFMATCDLSVCAVLYYLAAHRWEVWLLLVMQTSMLVSLLHLGASIAAPDWIDQEDYLLVLEIINYAAIILIGGVSGFVIARRQTGAAFAARSRVLPFSGIMARLRAAGRRT